MYLLQPPSCVSAGAATPCHHLNTRPFPRQHAGGSLLLLLLLPMLHFACEQPADGFCSTAQLQPAVLLCGCGWVGAVLCCVTGRWQVYVCVLRVYVCVLLIWTPTRQVRRCRGGLVLLPGVFHVWPSTLDWLAWFLLARLYEFACCNLWGRGSSSSSTPAPCHAGRYVSAAALQAPASVCRGALVSSHIVSGDRSAGLKFLCACCH